MYAIGKTKRTSSYKRTRPLCCFLLFAVRKEGRLQSQNFLEQEEMEQVEVLKEYRSIDISLDEFLEMMRNYKKERQSEKKMKEPEDSKEVEENREKIMEDMNEGN